MPTQSNVPRPDLSSIGRSGLKQYGGRIYDEWLPDLKDDRGRKVIREMMDQDAIIGAALLVMDLMLRRLNWPIEPFADEPADIEVASFVESCMHGTSTSWADTVSEIMTMLPFGWSWMETVYKVRRGDLSDTGESSRYNDGRVGWRKFAPRAQETLNRWEFDDGGGVQAMVQQDPSTGKLFTIPIQKSLLFRTSTRKGSPEGRSILRSAYRSWFFKKNIETIEGIGIERDLAGLPVAGMPAAFMRDDADAGAKAVYESMKKVVTDIRRDEQAGVVMPLAYDESGNKLYTLELLSTGGSRQFDTNAIINRYDSRIAMALMADFLLLGHEVHGSFALSDSKTNLFGFALGAFADVITGVFNSHAIPRLLRLNGMDTSRAPQMVHGDVESPNLAEIGGYITALANAGAPLFPDGKLEQRLLGIAGLPAPSDQDVDDRMEGDAASRAAGGQTESATKEDAA